VGSFIGVRTIAVALKVPQGCNLKFILIQNFGDANYAVGCADTAGRGAEVDSERAEHVLWDQETCCNTFTTNRNIRVVVVLASQCVCLNRSCVNCKLSSFS
jgi:hypothetical protein